MISKTTILVIAAFLIAAAAASKVKVNIFNDDRCRDLQTSFTFENDVSLCQAVGGGNYGKGQCSGGQATMTVYGNSACTGPSTDVALLREGMCGGNVFGGTGQSSNYFCNSASLVQMPSAIFLASVAMIAMIMSL